MPVPEPVVPLPEPLLPEPVLVGVELRVGCRPATGCEIVPEVEWRTEGRPDGAVAHLREEGAALGGDQRGNPAEFAASGLTSLTAASP